MTPVDVLSDIPAGRGGDTLHVTLPIAPPALKVGNAGVTPTSKYLVEMAGSKLVLFMPDSSAVKSL
jgi:hypothetical protein